MLRFFPVLALAALCVIAVGVVSASSPDGAHCRYRGQLPDPRCTPGDALRVSTRAVCTPGYAARVRDVSVALKDAVYTSYGVRRHPRYAYEVDHLVPLEIGGSNAQSNLWPQPAPAYHVKDALEDALHAAVCQHRMSLRHAQALIARNWVVALAMVPSGSRAAESGS
jgi:hypothetical protein